jgi:hypothetical protein
MVIDICIKANDLNEAFNRFVAEHPEITKEFAAWSGQIQCAGILHERKPRNTETRATIIELNPIEPSLANGFARGD